MEKLKITLFRLEIYICNFFSMINEAIMVYNIIWSLLYSHFLTVPYFLCQITRFLRQYLSSILFFLSLTMLEPPEAVYVYCLHAACTWSDQEREENAKLSKKRNNFAWVCVKLFWHMIYFANHRPETDSQSESLSHKGLGRRSPQIIRQYDFATAITIWPLNQPCTCKTGYSIFSSTSWLKFASTTRVSFPSMPSTEKKRRKMFLLLVAILTMFVLILFSPLIQERLHWLLILWVIVWFPKADVNYGLIMTLS